jgi:hypothetical protein
MDPAEMLLQLRCAADGPVPHARDRFPASRPSAEAGAAQVTYPDEDSSNLACRNLLDDCGHWKGCRQTMDEYFGQGGQPPLLLNRVGHSCYSVVKAHVNDHHLDRATGPGV